ncbi:MAG: serine/threonine-protein kinase [Polyangiaceae bacterium]
MDTVGDDDKTALLDPLFLRARSRVGSTLRNKWRLDTVLGVGGMATVYAATHRNGSRAAVKVLHAELSMNAQVRTRFLREGYVANSVGHDGAVRVIDDDTSDDGSLFLVTELLDGETLEERRLRSDGQMPEEDVLSVSDQLLDVLVAAHAKGIVHRDLKPENIFLTRAGQVKVLDFGIARLRELSTASTATKSGSTMGTPAYMAPEQARGLWAEVDARSDLWAVGATMFTLLSGHLVHEGRTTNEHLLSAMTQPAPPLASVLPRVGGAVAHLVDRALAFEKGKRWPDAARMQEAVRHAYHDRQGKPITTSPRLVVPETVPNRTLSDSAEVAPRLPTTGGPVTKSKGWTNPLRTLHVTSNPALAAIAAAVVTAIVGAIVWVAATGHTDAPRERPAVAASPGSSSAATELPQPQQAAPTAVSSPVSPPAEALGEPRVERPPAPRAFAVDALPRLAPMPPPASATAPPIGAPPTRTGGLTAPAVKATPAAKRDPLAP